MCWLTPVAASLLLHAVLSFLLASCHAVLCCAIAVDTWGHLVFLHLQGGTGTRAGTAGTEAKGVRGRGSSTAASSIEQQRQQQQSAGAGATPADGVVSQQPVGVAEWLGGLVLLGNGGAGGMGLGVASLLVNCVGQVVCLSRFF